MNVPRSSKAIMTPGVHPLLLSLLLASACMPVEQTPVSSGPPASPTVPIGHSSIRGRLLELQTGEPVAGATVGASSEELRIGRSTTTDTEGRYAFEALPAGRYLIITTKPEFLNWSHGQVRPSQWGAPVVLAERQVLEGVDVRMPRGAVVSGRITNSDGAPVSRALVTVGRWEAEHGQRRIHPVGYGPTRSGPTTTDETGAFRVPGLPPGEYVRGGQRGGERRLNGGATAPRTCDRLRDHLLSGHDADSLGADAEARPWAGGRLGRCGARLRPSRDDQRRGDHASRDPRDRRPRLGHGAAERSARRHGGERPDTPGWHLQRAWRTARGGPGRASLWERPTPDEPAAFPFAIVTVDGADVSGVRLLPPPPVTIRGHVSRAESASQPLPKPGDIRIGAGAWDIDDGWLGLGASAGGPLQIVKSDYTFALPITPGRFSVTAHAVGWHVDTVTLNGRDVSERQIDAARDGLTGIEIVLTDRVQTLTDTAVDDRGAGMGEDVVIAFPQDQSRWQAPFTRRFGLARPGADGRFTITDLPAGDYYVIALDRVGDNVNVLQDPELLERVRPRASTCSLAPGRPAPSSCA